MKRLIRVVRTTPGPAHSHRQSAALIAPFETLATLWKPVGATELPRGPSSLVLLSCMHHSAHPSIISPSVSAICSNAVRGFSHASCRVVATEGETPGTCRYLTTTHQASAILDSPASPPTPAPQRSSAASTTQGTTQSLSSDSSRKDPEEEGANTHGFAYWLEIALRSRRAAKRGREQRDPKISPTGGFKNGPTLKGKGSESVTGSIDPASSRHSTQQRHNGLLGLATHPQANSLQPQYTDGTHRNWSETKGGDPFPANKSSSGRGGGKGDGYPTTGGSSGDSRGHEGGGGMASVAGGSGGGSGGGGNEGGGGGTRPVQDSPVEPPLQGTVWKQVAFLQPISGM